MYEYPITSEFYEKLGAHAIPGKGGVGKVAGFILERNDEAMFMSIGELAEAAGVSAGTVSRAVRMMGFSGFADMQGQLRAVGRRNLTPAAKLDESLENEPKSREMISHDIKGLQEVLEKNSEAAFHEGARLLATAPAIHIMGMRSSYVAAFSLAIGLDQLRDNVHLMDMPASRLWEQIRRLEPGDLMVLVAFPRYVAATVNMIEEARRTGCDIMALTDGPLSPLAKAAKVAFHAPYESTTYFNTMVGSLGIVNTLLGKVGHMLHEEGRRKLEVHNAILERWGVLAKMEGE